MTKIEATHESELADMRARLDQMRTAAQGVALSISRACGCGHCKHCRLAALCGETWPLVEPGWTYERQRAEREASRAAEVCAALSDLHAAVLAERQGYIDEEDCPDGYAERLTALGRELTASLARASDLLGRGR